MADFVPMVTIVSFVKEERNLRGSKCGPSLSAVSVIFLDWRPGRVITPRTDFSAMRTSQKNPVHPSCIKNGRKHDRHDYQRSLHVGIIRASIGVAVSSVIFIDDF